jgi:hypothetical protein
MSEKAKARETVEKRKKARRYQGDRRQMIRWGPEDTDRRSGSGRRRDEKTLDCIKSVCRPPTAAGTTSSPQTPGKQKKQR